MAKKGRPRKNGLQPAWMLGRTLQVIFAYNEAKASGMKHSSAVTAAVEAVKKVWPEMPISETEVKRILATWQPKGSSLALKVIKGSDLPQPFSPAMYEMMGIPAGGRKNRLIFGFDRRPTYPRSNAKDSDKTFPGTCNWLGFGFELFGPKSKSFSQNEREKLRAVTH
jgi:hypothetical protein